MFYYSMWMLVHLTHLVLSSATLSNENFCVHFWSKMFLFLCVQQQQTGTHSATIGTENLLEANTMCYYSMWLLVQLTHLVFSSVTLSNENFCVYFWSKMLLFLCVQQQQTGFHSATTGTENLQETNTMFYYFMWMLVHPTHLVLSSASPSSEIFYCCSFLI